MVNSELKAQYDCIYLDPPWAFRVYSKDTGHGRSAESHYTTMEWEDIFNLPIIDLLKPDGVVFCWVTNAGTEECNDAIRFGWELQIVNKGFTWRKLTKNGLEAFGMGYSTRQNTETLMQYKRPGSSPYYASHSVRELQSFPIGEHSAKPPEFRTLIRTLMGEKDRYGNQRSFLEIFARPDKNDLTFKGWDVMGDGVDGQDIRVQLPNLLREKGIWTPDQVTRKRLNPTLTYGSVRALQLGRAFIVELQSDLPETKTALKNRLSVSLVLGNNLLLNIIKWLYPSLEQLSWLQPWKSKQVRGWLQEKLDNIFTSIPMDK